MGNSLTEEKNLHTATPYPDSPELRTAWEFMEHTGRSIFLTGKAGTGKTTFLRTVMERSRKRAIVVAPTGVAAINAGGVTIHSFFQLPFSPYVPGMQMKSKFEFGAEKRKIIASLDLLIIDEISMVRSDLLDAIDSVLRRFRDHGKPFGGVQLLLIGDLAQLTPVVTPDEERLLTAYYATPYFFGSKALAQIEYVTIQLEHVYRQQDTSFIEMLNHIRAAAPTARDLELLAGRSFIDFTPKAKDGYIRLTTHNHLANNYNEQELAKIDAPAYHFTAEISGIFPESSYPTALKLELKKGAQVMFIKNDPGSEHLYYNGRIGQITHISEHEIQVLCQGDDEPISVEPLEWENARYILNTETREIETEVQGIFRQYPLRLAWAITIHKSQGLTFDRAIIDANQSFAPGQVYVALSRCRSLDGLVLTSPLDQRAIISDNRVSSYMARQEQDAKESIALLPALKEEYGRHLLLELFDFHQITENLEAIIRLFSEYFSRSQANLYQLLLQASERTKSNVENVAEKWRTRIAQMPVSDLRNADFLDRVGAGAEYFAHHLTDILAEPIRLAESVKTENKQAKKLLAKRIPELRQTWMAHRYLLRKIAEKGFNVSVYLKEKQASTLDALDENMLKPKRERKVKTPKASKPKTWEVTHELYRQGRTPHAIAKERNLTTNTICKHLCRYVATGEIPVSDLVDSIAERCIRAVIGSLDETASLSTVKDLCPARVTWDDIHYVAAAMGFRQERSQD